MSLGAFLTAAAGPLAKRVVTALGFGVVTLVGADVAIGGLIASARDAYTGLPADVLAYCAYGGLGTALSIIAGAFTTRIALLALKSYQLL